MRWLPPLLLLAACAGVPPRFTDRSTPEGTWRTFRGAVARAEHAREWECLSDPLRARLGLASRGDWEDLRVVALRQGDRAVRWIQRGDIDGAHPLPDGRVRLALGFPLGIRGSVVLRPVPVLRVLVAGEAEPRVYLYLPDIAVVESARGFLIRVPERLMGEMRGPGEPPLLPDGAAIERIEARVEWFLDDFALGDETPDSIQARMEAEGTES